VCSLVSLDVIVLLELSAKQMALLSACSWVILLHCTRHGSQLTCFGPCLYVYPTRILLMGFLLGRASSVRYRLKSVNSGFRFPGLSGSLSKSLHFFQPLSGNLPHSLLCLLLSVRSEYSLPAVIWPSIHVFTFPTPGPVFWSHSILFFSSNYVSYVVFPALSWSL